ncbi:MAG: selenium-dependent xanthine dehydrogenase [Lachnospiraceae bacterium]|nr:selenium-dependent xanthine dehydrogenase [Lachnospiraceae bacterium]
MFYLKINGKQVNVLQDKPLLRVLRDDCHLTSVKDGCSEGACGTCTILVDGKKSKACVHMASRFQNTSITTVEGLSEREKEVYVYAFGEAGAVQCGFCIPGMVLCAKSLLDHNLNPSIQDVKYAIKGNICRCTGYKKIEDAFFIAAKMFREDIPVPKEDSDWKAGQRRHRVDVPEKVLGYGQYPDDIYMDGMLYGSAVRSKYPRALVKKIDITEASKMPGVHGVLTAADIPGGNTIGHIQQDWETLIPEGGITRFLGDGIVLVAAETRQQLEAAKEKVKIEYEELPAVFSAEEGLREDAPLVHEQGNILSEAHLVRGDADGAIAKSAHVVTKHYSTPFTEHAFLEPECAVAICNKEAGTALIYSADQGTYQTQTECAKMLGLPMEQVHVINKLVGGGFGGKEDMTVQHHAALLSWHTGRPVKVKLTRQESIQIHPKRHPMEMDFTTACDENGYLTGMKATLLADTGAYASLGGPVLQRACTHAAGPYNYQDVDIHGTAVYTNNPPAGAFRGFGVTQSCFATECNLNLLAEMVGISPWEIRYRNAIRPGQELPNGQLAAPGTALAETLEAVKDIYENNPYVGVACAMKNAGVGVGLPDYGRCLLTVEEGKIIIRSGASCIGQGLGTVLKQIVCDVTGLPGGDVEYTAAETGRAPDSGTTSGSRQTLVTGEAVRRACEDIKKDLAGKTLSDLNGKEYYGEYLAATDPMGADKPHPVSHVAYGFATQAVVLNEDCTVNKVYAAHDVGRAINPLSVEGQIEGGVVMSMGFALTEDFPLKDGKPLRSYGTLGLFRAPNAPEVESIIVEKNQDPLALGAIGVGEITSIPTPPAVQGAYYKLDGKFRTSLPLEETPYSRKR